jgi:hypothetical protein
MTFLRDSLCIFMVNMSILIFQKRFPLQIQMPYNILSFVLHTTAIIFENFIVFQIFCNMMLHDFFKSLCIARILNTGLLSVVCVCVLQVWERHEMHIGTPFWWGNLLENVHLEDLEIVGRMKLIWIVGNYMDVSWMELTQNRVQTPDFVLAVLNLGVLLL